MTKSMVKKMAVAMFDQDHDEGWNEGEEPTRRIYLNNARAAMKAMRLPTKVMLNAGNKNIQGQANDPEWPSDPPFASAIWLSMIDAELEIIDPERGAPATKEPNDG